MARAEKPMPRQAPSAGPVTAGPSKRMSNLRSYGIIILIAFALRATVVEAYIVPTGSMKRTILVGDFLVGNKFIYGMRTPDRLGIPYTSLGFNLPWVRLPAFRKPKIGDVVIFKYPHNPLDKYVKRLIAGPGQTVEIRDREVFVDGVPFIHPPQLQFIKRDMEDPQWSDPNIFPRGNGNKDNYGQIRIPARGDRLSPIHERDALWYVASMDGHSLRRQGNTIFVDDQPVSEYTVEQDYYFMMGDNRDESFDSRFWGFVPHKYILGEALFVYFSVNMKSLPPIRIDRLKRIGMVIR